MNNSPEEMKTNEPDKTFNGECVEIGREQDWVDCPLILGMKMAKDKCGM